MTQLTLDDLLVTRTEELEEINKLRNELDYSYFLDFVSVFYPWYDVSQE